MELLHFGNEKKCVMDWLHFWVTFFNYNLKMLCESLKQKIGFSSCHLLDKENVLGYYRNLGSLRYGNDSCIEDALWEKTFFPLQLKPISITQLWLHVIGSSRIENKQSTAVASEPMAIQPTIACQKKRGVWLYIQPL